MKHYLYFVLLITISQVSCTNRKINRRTASYTAFQLQRKVANGLVEYKTKDCICEDAFPVLCHCKKGQKKVSCSSEFWRYILDFQNYIGIGPFTNCVTHFFPLFDHPPKYGYVLAIILLINYLSRVSNSYISVDHPPTSTA